jgi:hypothetical protein
LHTQKEKEMLRLGQGLWNRLFHRRVACSYSAIHRPSSATTLVSSSSPSLLPLLESYLVAIFPSDIKNLILEFALVRCPGFNHPNPRAAPVLGICEKANCPSSFLLFEDMPDFENVCKQFGCDIFFKSLDDFKGRDWLDLIDSGSFYWMRDDCNTCETLYQQVLCHPEDIAPGWRIA